jgi:hypothetical protein
MTFNVHSHLEAVKEPMPFEQFQARRRQLRQKMTIQHYGILIDWIITLSLWF